MKGRRHPEQRDALSQAFALWRRLAIEEAQVDHEAALMLAVETGPSAYDASYLWLARTLDAELVTLDRRLAAADGATRGRTRPSAKRTRRDG